MPTPVYSHGDLRTVVVAGTRVRRQRLPQPLCLLPRVGFSRWGTLPLLSPPTASEVCGGVAGSQQELPDVSNSVDTCEQLSPGKAPPPSPIGEVRCTPTRAQRSTFPKREERVV